MWILRLLWFLNRCFWKMMTPFVYVYVYAEFFWEHPDLLIEMSRRAVTRPKKKVTDDEPTTDNRL